MSFTTPCFIRKNTPELRKKLEELGYIPPYKIWSDENFAICTIYRDNIGEYIVFKIDDDFENVIKPSYPYIDCGTNEDMFLAIAALRDDSNENQWLTDGKIWGKFDEDSFLHPIQIINYLQSKGHKASIEEIIEHFKDKQYDKGNI